MASSEEYLARLGFDTSSAQKSAEQMVTVLGHMGNQFDELSKASDAGQRGFIKAAGGVDTFNKSAKNSVDQQKQINSSLPRLRYALYDVSNAAGIAGAALLGSAVIVEKTAIDYQRLFADVERTSKGLNDIQLDGLRNQLVGLTSDIPVAFADVAKIATLGNQLDIDPSNLASFTKTVAEFAATTDVSVDAAATAFGRLGQILHTSDYRALGDDIAYLGVNAVATESQIINVGRQIAVSANAAGYSAEQTLALATALASLGVAPEAARGTILRVFGQINAAVASGGEKLNDLAAISGKSAGEFAANWKDNAAGAFRDFLGGLSASGASVQSSLAAVGVTATRDVQAIGLLSQNLGVLDQANVDVTNSNGYLDKSFGVVLDTVSSKLQILQNNVNRVFDTIGAQANGPFANALDIINGGLEKLNQILSNPIAAGGVAITGTIVALVGVLGLASSAVFRYAATLLAIRSAGVEAGVSQGILKTTLDVVTFRFGTAAAGAAELAAAEGGVAIAGDAAAASQARVGASAAGASGGASKLTGVLGKIGLIGSLLAIIPLMPALVDGFQDWFNQLKGTASGVDELTKKIQGLNSEAAKTNTEAIQKLLSNDGAGPVSFHNVPFSGDNSQTITGARAYLNKQTTGQTVPGQDISFLTGGGQINQAESQAESAIKSYDGALAQLAQSGNLKAVQDGIKLYHEEMKKAGLSTQEADSLLTETNSTLGVTAGQSTSAAAAAKDLASGTEDGASAFKDYIDAAYGASNAQQELSDNLGKLGEAFYTNGADAASNGQEIQAVIQSIYASSNGASDAAAQLQGFFDALVKGGYASADQLAQLQLVIFQLTGGQGTTGTDFSLKPFTQGLDKATKSAKSAGGAAGGAAKEIRTLVDYANDLRGVFSRSFDLRFGGGIAFDAITSGWNSIKKAIADTNEQIRQYQATISQLNADNAAQKYFLSVAQNYGDTLRAAEITAQIAKNNADLDQTTRDLTDAQQKNSKTLVGNSDAAIANRAELSGLVKNYEDYITQLASSGLSQAELSARTAQLKQDFINQALQLGYTTDQVYGYAAAFDDVTTAIGRVPRNITVAANVNPALQALNELDAKAKSISNTTYSGPTFSGGGIDASAAKTVRAQALQAEAAMLQRSLGQTSGSISPQYAFQRLQQIAASLASGQYKDGGWTGGGNPNDAAGIVHRREFVLNETGAQMLPQSTLNGMNNGIPPQASGFAFNSSKGVDNSAQLNQMIALLQGIYEKTGWSISGDAMTEAANLGNVNSTRRGRG